MTNGEQMTLGEMMDKIRTILPNASCGEDNDGQIIIFSDMKLGKIDELTPME